MMTKALEKNLRKGESAKAFLGPLTEATELLLNLDAGMVDGAMLSRERRETLTAATLKLAREWLDRAAALFRLLRHLACNLHEGPERG